MFFVLKSFKETELRVSASGDFELVGIKCKSCDETIFGLHPQCPNCFSKDYNVITLDKRGIIRNYTIAHVPPYPEWRGPLPYVIVDVELPGGARMLTRLSESDYRDSRINIGAPVNIELEEVDKDEEGNSIVIYVAKLSSQRN